MKTIPSIAFVTLLLLVLSGLSLLGMDPQASRYDGMLSVVSKFSVTESALRQDILNARAGLLRDYDPVNRRMTALHGFLGQLRQQGVDPKVLGPLEEMVGEQDELAEQFKSDNALLQNSLAYFGLLSGKFGSAVQEGPLASAMTVLATSMLHLTLDTSVASAGEVEAALNRLAQQAPVDPDNDLVDGILAHGRLLHDLLPATDQVLRSLYDLPRSARLEAVRSSVLAHQQASRANARRYELLLYVTSMLLLAWLVYLGSQLRRHFRALQRRATFEHAIAAISIGFVDSRADEIDRRVTSALATLAEWVGADRAYFIGSSEQLRPYWWCRDGRARPPEWPMQGLAVAKWDARAEGVIYIPSVERMPEGAEKSALKGAGLRGWICIPANGLDGSRGALGFDAIGKPMTWPASDSGLLRMAVEPIANAVEHAVLERDRTRLESSLQQARRMETIGALASGVAHNFNNIIGAILGYTEMEESHAFPKSRLARNLEGIRHAAERARDLIDQILNFGRRKNMPHRTIALRSLMAETQSLLQASLQPDVRLVIGATPEAAIVSGDPVQLQQVIMNLCNNAAQAMDCPCTAEVTTEIHRVLVTRQLSHGCLVPGSYVRISVRDTGRGMDAETLDRLFEPFFTTRLGGNGLGLATVREIVRDHGGAIDVRSQLGEGSLFEVWLPQIAGTSRILHEAGTMQGSGEAILVIDDDHARLLHDEEIVAALGYEPIGFADPDQALSACRLTPRRFDAALISHLMPIAQALAVTKKLHGMAPDLPILLACSAGELGADELAGAGVCEVVSKPLVSAELAAALSRWLPS
jgi:signal transduction histidine kinase/CheY-like chemotaxis protein